MAMLAQEGRNAMPVPLSRILANRPRGGDRAKEWIGTLSLPEATLSMGEVAGSWDPRLVPLPLPPDQGLALGLQECLVSRFDKIWSSGPAAVWQILSCQEDSDFVPGVRVFQDPSPPCMLCQACADGNHVDCVESGARRWSPGWISRETVVGPWGVGRGLIELPARASVRGGLFLDPLSRVFHGLKRLGKIRPHRIAVVGDDLVGLLAGLVLEREYPDSVRCLVHDSVARGDLARDLGFQREVGFAIASERFEPQLAVVADSRSESVDQALAMCARGGTVLLLVPPDAQPRSLQLAELWRRGIHVVSGMGVGPDDRDAANRCIEDLSKRLEALPVAELPFERAAQAHELLDADPGLVGVALKA